jgi:CRP-like cAMP-binding protein
MSLDVAGPVCRRYALGVVEAPSVALERILRASRLFGGLDAAFLAAMCQSASKRRLERGDALWRTGETANQFVLIVQGLVEIVRRAADGTESILAIFGPRESIGDSAALAARAYPADAIALTEVVEVLVVPAGPIREAARSRPEVGAAFNASLIEHMNALQNKIGIMTAGSVPKRLSALFLHLLERFGDVGDDGASFIPVSLSRAELARLVGARVETIIRTMSRWQKAGLIDTGPDGFTVRSQGALRAILSSTEAAAGEDGDG